MWKLFAVQHYFYGETFRNKKSDPVFFLINFLALNSNYITKALLTAKIKREVNI